MLITEWEKEHGKTEWEKEHGKQEISAPPPPELLTKFPFDAMINGRHAIVHLEEGEIVFEYFDEEEVGWEGEDEIASEWKVFE